MDRDEIVSLTAADVELAVSIVVSIDPHDPTHRAARQRASVLVASACELLRNYAGDDAIAMADRLRSLGEQLDIGPRAAGLAIFVSADESHVIDVPFPVTEQLTIEGAFATRQLLVGLAHAPRVRVLVLQDGGARLYDDREGELVELRWAGFPIRAPMASEHGTSRGHQLREAGGGDEGRIDPGQVDRALEAVGGDRVQIVVVGSGPGVVDFVEASDHQRQILGFVPGRFADASPASLELAVRPVIAAAVGAHEDAVVRRLLEEVGEGRAITDFPSVWAAARAGRGELLVIEQDASRPLHLTDGLTPGDEPDEPWTLDDAVDELIEHVARSGGEIQIVAHGKLDSIGGIGLTLRPPPFESMT